MINRKTNKRVATKNKSGVINGFLVPIYNVHDKFVPEWQEPKQVYLTVAFPGEIKGPHLHLKRSGSFTCIKGDLMIVTREDGKYEEWFSGENHGFATIQVPPGVPSALVNIGKTDAYILNMPSPAWHIDDQDDHPVTFDDYDLTKFLRTT